LHDQLAFAGKSPSPAELGAPYPSFAVTGTTDDDVDDRNVGIKVDLSTCHHITAVVTLFVYFIYYCTLRVETEEKISGEETGIRSERLEEEEETEEVGSAEAESGARRRSSELASIVWAKTRDASNQPLIAFSVGGRSISESTGRRRRRYRRRPFQAQQQRRAGR